MLRLHIDAHVHIYPFYDLGRFLLSALDHMPRLAPTDQRILLLAERRDCTFFQSLAQDEISLPDGQWRIAAWDPDGGVKLRHIPTHRDLWLIAGRQMVAAENIEICSLFSDAAIDDGLPALETIRAIQAADGLPALNWAFGKWLFKRGRLIKQLANAFPPSDLVLVDTSIRPTIWPPPALYRRARKQHRAVLAGTDPLPAQGEEQEVGRYYATLQIPVPENRERLVAPLRAALQNPSTVITRHGRRNTPAHAQRRRKQPMVPAPDYTRP